MDEEIPLAGGNVSTVVRVGQTVRRNTGPWTPAVHVLLRYLEEAGFEGAPRPLGIDDQGREILSFLEGEVYEYPMPDHVWSEETLTAVARLLRRYHDLLAGFQPPPDAVWQIQVGAPSEGAIICHNDIAPYNTVFKDRQPVGFIDWDLATPGPPLYDVAYAVWFYVPLYDAPETPAENQPWRLRLFCDAYGLSQTDRRLLLPTVHRRQEAAYRTIETWGKAGKPGWAEMWRTGHAAGKRRDQQWLERHRPELEKELDL